jgi:hypothetical protein
MIFRIVKQELITDAAGTTFKTEVVESRFDALSSIQRFQDRMAESIKDGRIKFCWYYLQIVPNYVATSEEAEKFTQLEQDGIDPELEDYE